MKNRKTDESGQVSGLVILIAGFAVVALASVLWIGNTTAGAGADVAKCVSSKAATDGSGLCMSNEKSATAYVRQAQTQLWQDRVSNTQAVTAWDAAVEIAKRNLDIGLERFISAKRTAAVDNQPYITALANATTVAQAKAALANLHAGIVASRQAGEARYRSGVSLDSGAGHLEAVQHPASYVYREGRELTHQGNLLLERARDNAQAGATSTTMSLAQLKAFGPSIQADLVASKPLYEAGIVKLKEAETILYA